MRVIHGDSSVTVIVALVSERQKGSSLAAMVMEI